MQDGFGVLLEKWMEYKLADIFELQMGKTPDRHNDAYWDKGTEEWISIADLSNCDKFIEETKEQITQLAIAESGIKMIPKNTVVMSFKLSIGKLAITSKPMYSNEAIMAFVNKSKLKIDPSYLYYSFMHKNWDVGTNKAVMGKTLNKVTLSQIKIKIHVYDEQLEIVSILDKVGLIITQRKEQLKSLDTLTKSRFVELFGDMISNSKRWTSAFFGDIYDITSSKRILKSEWKDRGIPFLRVRDMVQLADTGKMNNEFFVSEEFYGSLNDVDGIPKQGDILMSATSTLGKCYLVGDGEKFYFKDADVLRFRAKRKINPIFFIEMMKTDYIIEQIRRTLGITTVSHFTIKAAKQIEMRIPDIELQNQFATFVQKINKLKL